MFNLLACTCSSHIGSTAETILAYGLAAVLLALSVFLCVVSCTLWKEK